MSKTILIADDNVEFLQFMTLRCESLGLHVMAVEDALTALSSADFAAPDLICMDVEMPGGNGLAACEMILDNAEIAKTPLIVLTGRSDDQTLRRCREMNVHLVRKGGDLWPRLKPLLLELLELEPAAS